MSKAPPHLSLFFRSFFKAFILFLLLTIVLLNFNNHREEQFIHLSKSFLQGKLYFTEQPGNDWLDTIYRNGHYYWHTGPAPAVILAPFVFLFSLAGQSFHQGYLQIFLSAGIFYLCYLLAKKYKYKHQDAIYLALVFCIASPYIIIAYLPWSWYFLQALVVFALFLSLHEWFGKRRYWIIGVCFAVILASRVPAAIGILFFISELWAGRKKSMPFPARPLIQLLLPLAISALLLGWYNYARLGNPFDTGFKLSNNHYKESYYNFEQTNYGILQFRNIPTNIYYYFLKPVDPIRIEYYSNFGQTYVLKFPYITVKYPGVSLFASAPIFLYAVYAAWKKRKLQVIKSALIPIVIIQFLLLMYYYPGWKQVGPRYTLDYLPFLFLILLHTFPNSKLPGTAKAVIISGLFFSTFLVFSTFLQLP